MMYRKLDHGGASQQKYKQHYEESSDSESIWCSNMTGNDNGGRRSTIDFSQLGCSSSYGVGLESEFRDSKPQFWLSGGPGNAGGIIMQQTMESDSGHREQHIQVAASQLDSSDSQQDFQHHHQHPQAAAPVVPPAINEFIGLQPELDSSVGHSFVEPQYLGVDVHPNEMVPVPVPVPVELPEEEPVYVNAKQYHGILRRRQSRAKAELEKKVVKVRKPYLHESRHLHAMRRERGCGGRFLSTKKNHQQKHEQQIEEGCSSDNKNSRSANVNTLGNVWMDGKRRMRN
ncbi:Nuclear transcription factor Y subunit A-3 [Linum perenne]